MIQFEQFNLDNGLQVLVHEDHDTEIAVMNLLYDVGSRDEDESKTGFAHLFEHLMFGGSKNIKSYDEALQVVGGENNAFTSPDITNYYLTLPANNLETGFWLESDRMMELSWDPNVLEVQRKVVIEEFKQRYLNQPYGDEWLLIRPEAYKLHPYKWPTIGKEISHIENAHMDDVRDFFNKYYHPGNATLVVAGNVKTHEIQKLAEKWFGNIPEGPKNDRILPAEPQQSSARLIEHDAKVPVDSLTKVYHMPGRLESNCYSTDLAGDMLGRGTSSRLYHKLVKENKMFSNLQCYITGSIDPGLVVISGRISPEVSLVEADEAVQAEVQQFFNNGFDEKELEKVKTQAESTLVFSGVDLLNKAMNIAFGANLGNPNLINEEKDHIRNVTVDDIQATKNIFDPNNCTTLRYRAVN